MAELPAHQDNTKRFSELTDAEQAKSISAQILNLEAAIEHRISHTLDRQSVVDGCTNQVERLLNRLKAKYP